jgi:5-bromo-4-chloroindolyl phosphate hydrolysis protein
MVNQNRYELGPLEDTHCIFVRLITNPKRLYIHNNVFYYLNPRWVRSISKFVICFNPVFIKRKVSQSFPALLKTMYPESYKWEKTQLQHSILTVSSRVIKLCVSSGIHMLQTIARTWELPRTIYSIHLQRPQWKLTKPDTTINVASGSNVNIKTEEEPRGF